MKCGVNVVQRSSLLDTNQSARKTKSMSANIMTTKRPYKTQLSKVNATIFRSVTNLLTEALFLIDQNDRIILANNAAQTMIGLPESALLGNDIAPILSLPFSHHRTKTHRIKLPAPDVLTLPARVHALSYKATFVPLPDLANFTQFQRLPAALVIVTPISSPQIDANAATTIYLQFVGNLTMRIAHDLNNSLTSIIGNTQLIHEHLIDLLTAPTPEAIASLSENVIPELHDVIRKSGEIAHFINGLREFARQQPVTTHSLDLNIAINETLAIARSMLDDPIIQIDFLPADELPRISIDRLRIDQMLLSIFLTCKNGLPSGGRIIVETESATLGQEFTATHPGARPGTYARLSITDSSAGMDSEQVKRIFDFQTGEDSDSAGLLPIVYSIVKRFGGYINVESWPGKGTRFDIYIPSIPITPSTSPIHEERVLAPTPSQDLHASTLVDSSLILVADDDSDIQLTIGRSVSRAGYETIFAADGKTALDLYKRLTAERKQPALLIADLGLPEIDGRTLSITIQHEFPSARILLTSGYKIDINPRTGKTQEGFTFLQKPFEPNALLTTIERLLKQEDPQHSSVQGT